MSDSRIELLTFEIWHERIGIPLVDVREVVRAVSISRLPKARLTDLRSRCRCEAGTNASRCHGIHPGAHRPCVPAKPPTGRRGLYSQPPRST
jgi:hypothetical protein